MGPGAVGAPTRSCSGWPWCWSAGRCRRGGGRRQRADHRAVGRGQVGPRRRPDRRGDRLRLRQPGTPRHLPRRARAGPGRPGPGRLAQRPRPGRGQRHRPAVPPAHRRPRPHGPRTPPLYDRPTGWPGSLPAGGSPGTRSGRPGRWGSPGRAARGRPYRLEDARCVQGGAGSQAPCPVAQPEPGHLVATVESWMPRGRDPVRHRRTRLAAAPALPGPPAPPANPGTGPVPPALVAAAAAWWRPPPPPGSSAGAGREQVAPAAPPRPPSAGMGRPATDPGGHGGPGPAGHHRVRAAEELTPAQGGVLLAEAVHPEHKVAWLIGAAVDGHLDLEDDGGQVTLVRLPAAGRHLPARRGLRGARPPHPRQLRSELRLRLAAGRQRAGRLAADVPLWDPAGDRRRALARPSAPWPGWPGCS